MPTARSNSVPETPASAFRRRRAPIAISRVDWKAFAIAMVLLPVAHWLFAGDGRASRSEAILRPLFNIPADVEFSESRYPRRQLSNSIEGYVEFTHEQFADYIRKLDDPSIWQAKPIEMRGGGVELPFSPRALSWNDLPKPVFAGVRRVRWGGLSNDRVTGAKVGRALCLAYRFPPGHRKSDWTWRVEKGTEHLLPPLESPAHLDRYNAINCSEMGRSEKPAGYVLGLIDFRTKTLHMVVK